MFSAYFLTYKSIIKKSISFVVMVKRKSYGSGFKTKVVLESPKRKGNSTGDDIIPKRSLLISPISYSSNPPTTPIFFSLIPDEPLPVQFRIAEQVQNLSYAYEDAG